MLDVKALAAGLLTSVQEWISPTIKAIDDRLVALDKAIKAIPASPPDIGAIVRDEVATAVAALPRPKDGEPGRDADPAAIIKAAAEAVAALPKPQDGKSVTPEEVKALVDAAVATLPKPKDGESVDPETVRAMVRESVDAIPRPKDGTSVTADELQPMLADLVSKAIGALPKAKDGADADPEHVAALVKQAAYETPAPAAGKDADPEVIRSMVAEAVAAIPKPQDGKSLTPDDMVPVLEGVVAKWALDFERRAADVLQRAVDRIPVPKDGRDGLSIEDLSVEHDGDGGVTIKFQRGDTTKEFTLRLPRFKDCGVFRDGVDHKAGDGVTWGGSFFIAQKDAPAGKPGDSDDWRLAVKRGRDGKDAPAATAPAVPVRLR